MEDSGWMGAGVNRLILSTWLPVGEDDKHGCLIGQQYALPS